MSDKRTTEIALSGNDSVLWALGKALSSSASAASEKPANHPAGEFNYRGMCYFEISGNTKADYQADRYFGVGIDDMFNILMATMPGFVEDNMRRACHVAAEVKRAEMEERPIADTVWVNENGESIPISAEEIGEIMERVEGMKERAEETLAPFAKCIKVKRPAKGQIKISSASIEILEEEKAAA